MSGKVPGCRWLGCAGLPGSVGALAIVPQTPQRQQMYGQSFER
jgi:hypothetical protein